MREVAIGTRGRSQQERNSVPGTFSRHLFYQRILMGCTKISWTRGSPVWYSDGVDPRLDDDHDSSTRPVGRPIVRVFGDFLLAAGIVLALDLGLFHLGAYFPVLKPDSHSGRMEQSARRFQAAVSESPDRRRVLVVGDSTTQAAVQETQLERRLTRSGVDVSVFNMSMGGSTPRTWYHLLNHEAFWTRNTDLVIIGIQPNSLRATRFVKPDLKIIKTRLRVLDAPWLSRTYDGVENRLSVFFGTLYRTPLFVNDLKDLLGAPSKRLTTVKARKRWERNFSRGWRPENNKTENLASARLGDVGRLIDEELDPFIRDDPELRSLIERDLPRTTSNRPPRKRSISEGNLRLLSKMVHGLSEKGVPVLIVVNPATPYPSKFREIEFLSGLVDQLRSEGADVSIYNGVDVLEEVEAPQYFRDMLHLNGPGAKVFTCHLSDHLVELLSEPDGPKPG